MKKFILSALVFTPLFVGCMATSNTDSAANLDRNAAVAELTTRMDNLGYYYPVEVQPGIDEFLNMSAMILERQRNVMGDYRTQTDNYRDVQAFLYAHEKSTPEELQAAITKFDAGATNKNEKIGDKIASYNKANEGIYQKNVELATQLTIEIAKSAIILSNYGPEIAKITAINYGASAVTSLFSSDEEEEEVEDSKDIATVLIKAKDQLFLALEANDIIELEQLTITAINNLQLEQEAKS
ncbi:hypothetical protein H4J58_15785 [Colwellia sp. MB3u-70]|uniref:hypothetical protein n=1 Tax=unclassified Colwellia TaxID=196834 RepID=UPI0015F46D81|nr:MULTISPECIES: hypothetical protein [unclassified Colwellia]MBA6291928.1 hypothetical protein [Colwellia sp. MB3u-8]MBA6308572.1 hypothetical protein [Colwellia sp. MB3u-70]